MGSSILIAEPMGIGIVFTHLTTGIPANFSRFVTNPPAFHDLLVFLCVKSVPVPHVPPDERYLVGRVGPAAHRSYRCIVRYGYRDFHQDIDSFESKLVDKLADFIYYDWCRRQGLASSGNKDDRSQSGQLSNECRLAVLGTVAFSVAPESVSVGSPTVESVTDVAEMEPFGVVGRRVRFAAIVGSESEAVSEMEVELQEELQALIAAQPAGTAFIISHSHVKAKQESSLLNRLAINCV